MHLHTLDLLLGCLDCQKNVQALEHLVGELLCWRLAVVTVASFSFKQILTVLHGHLMNCVSLEYRKHQKLQRLVHIYVEIFILLGSCMGTSRYMRVMLPIIVLIPRLNTSTNQSLLSILMNSQT